MQQVTCHTHGKTDAIFIPCQEKYCVGSFCEWCEYGYNALCVNCASHDFLWSGGDNPNIVRVSALDVLLSAKDATVSLIYWPKHSPEPTDVWTRDATDAYQEFNLWAALVLELIHGDKRLPDGYNIGFGVWTKAQLYSDALAAVGIYQEPQDAEFERLLLKFAPVPERHKVVA